MFYSEPTWRHQYGWRKIILNFGSWRLDYRLDCKKLRVSRFLTAF